MPWAIGMPATGRPIYDLAVKRNPNVEDRRLPVSQHAARPRRDVKLNKNIFGEFVIYGSRDGWFPMSREEEQWYRDQWLGWEKTGMSLVSTDRTTS